MQQGMQHTARTGHIAAGNEMFVRSGQYTSLAKGYTGRWTRRRGPTGSCRDQSTLKPSHHNSATLSHLPLREPHRHQLAGILIRTHEICPTGAPQNPANSAPDRRA